jgi:hypothetical protein
MENEKNNKEHEESANFKQFKGESAEQAYKDEHKKASEKIIKLMSEKEPKAMFVMLSFEEQISTTVAGNPKDLIDLFVETMEKSEHLADIIMEAARDFAITQLMSKKFNNLMKKEIKSEEDSKEETKED